MTTLSINGESHTVDAPPDMPLLWVLRDLVGLTGTKFGCGIAQCGACTVHLDGQAVRSCVLPVAAVGSRKITTIEAVSTTPAGKKVQDAWRRARRRAVRVLSVGSGHVGGFADRLEPESHGCRYRRCHGRQHLPLRYVQPYPCRGQARRQGGVTCRKDCSMHRIAAQPDGVNRRTFLKLGVSVGAAVGGGLMLGFSLPAASQGDAPKAKSVIGGDGNETPQSGVFEPNAFVQIDAAGKVTLVIPKVEMGQGVYTSIPMLIAEELEVPLESVVIDHAPPNEKLFMDPLLGGQLTGGSTSIRYAWEPMRQRRRDRTRAAYLRGGAAMAGRSRVMPRGAWRSGACREQPAHRLRATGRCRRETARAAERAAQGPEGFQADRHGRQASRLAGESGRHRRVRTRRPRAGHGVRGHRE